MQRRAKAAEVHELQEAVERKRREWRRRIEELRVINENAGDNV